MNQKKNRCAIYCRLSVDDGIDQESQSIQNQKEVLTEYCNDNKFKIVDVFIDDGYSGTNFDRPSFKKMIERIEQGDIDIVLTKDLSRLGRDYLKTGYYTEQYFPEHNVRYLALNDRVDTSEGLDDMIPLKNIMNEFYARDISKKVRFTVSNQMIKGEDKKTGMPLYGYRYDENSKRVISEAEAKIVRKIFHLFIEGNSVSSISKILASEQILAPRANFDSKFQNNNKYIWRDGTIRSILSNSEYLGHYIRKKTKTFFKSKKKIMVPKEEQYVFKNKYPAIITEAEFEMAQNLLEATYKSQRDILKKNPYAGLCFCGKCGYRLNYIHHTSGSGITENRIVCPNKEYAKGSIKIDDLTLVLKNELTNLKNIILSHKEEFLDQAKLKSYNIKTNTLTKPEEEKYQRLLKRNEELNYFIKNLTEQLTNEIINQNIYNTMMNEYREEKEQIESSINRYKIIVENEQVDLDHQAHILVDTLEKISDEDLLSQGFIRNIISKILITSIPEEHTTTKRKEITIIYKKCNEYLKDFMNSVKDN